MSFKLINNICNPYEGGYYAADKQLRMTKEFYKEIYCFIFIVYRTTRVVAFKKQQQLLVRNWK